MKRASRRRGFPLLAAILLAILAAGIARAGTGRLVVYLETKSPPLFSPTLTLSGANRSESAVIGAVAITAGEVRFADLDPGTYTLGVEGIAGADLEIEVPVPACGTAAAVYDIDRATLSVAPVAPDPFGIADLIDADWIAAMPGEGSEAARGMLTGGATPRPTRLEGLDLTGGGFRRTVELRSFAVGRSLRSPIGIAPASEERASFQVLSAGGDRFADIEAATGNLGRSSFDGSIVRRLDTTPWKPRFMLALRAMNYLDAAGSVFESDRLPHNGLDELELLGRVDARPGAKLLLTALAYGEGTQRQYFVESYRYNPSHSPREDRADFQGALRVQRRPSGDALQIGEIGWQRTYVATGDGRYFDDLREYGRPYEANRQTDEHGIYWAGDDRSTLADEGHVYNYFRKIVQNDLTARLEHWMNPGTAQAWGAGLHFRRGTYRSYEHLNPIQTFLGAGGYTTAQAIGYGIDGTDHDDASERAPGHPLSVAAFATARRPLGEGEIEAGLRATLFRPGQRPVANPSNPIVNEDGAERLDLGDAKSRVTLDPRFGYTRQLAPRIRVWSAAGIETHLPPAEALYYSEEFLRRIAFAADPGHPNTVLGNPGLKPERDWSLVAAAGIDLAPGLSARIGGEGRRTSDAITAAVVPAGIDSLVYYRNDGSRDRIGLFARLDWEPSRWLRMRGSYDLSKSRTETADPVLLDGAWLDPDLPIRGADITEGLPFAFPSNDDGIERDPYPSLYDRRHVGSLAVRLRTPADIAGDAGRVIFTDFEIGALFRFASGRPFTWMQLYPFGELLTDSRPHEATGEERNSGRLPEVYQLHLRVSRKLRVFGADVSAWAEVLNATDRENEIRVFPTTGDAEDDGWLAFKRGLPASYVAAYSARLRDLHNYGNPRSFRFGLRVGAGI